MKIKKFFVRTKEFSSSFHIFAFQTWLLYFHITRHSVQSNLQSPKIFEHIFTMLLCRSFKAVLACLRSCLPNCYDGTLRFPPDFELLNIPYLFCKDFSLIFVPHIFHLARCWVVLRLRVNGQQYKFAHSFSRSGDDSCDDLLFTGCATNLILNSLLETAITPYYRTIFWIKLTWLLLKFWLLS